jgi:hypothetical protein
VQIVVGAEQRVKAKCLCFKGEAKDIEVRGALLRLDQDPGLHKLVTSI